MVLIQKTDSVIAFLREPNRHTVPPTAGSPAAGMLALLGET